MKKQLSEIGLFLFIASVTPCALMARAESPPADTLGWDRNAAFQLHFTQTQFDNWAQGGENSSSWLAGLNARFVHRAEVWRWDTSVKMEYGKSSIESLGSRKAGDEIFVESLYRRHTGSVFQPYVAATFRSQFDRGFEYPESADAIEISGFLDPGYATQSAGMVVYANPQLSIRTGAALKETFTRNHPVPYADDPDTDKTEKTRVESGLEGVVDWECKLNSIITYVTKLESFSNLKSFSKIDLNWDHRFSAQLASFLNVGYHVNIIYDSDISKKRQIRQILSVGFIYQL